MSQLNMNKPVDLQLKARLDRTYEMLPFVEKRIGLPLIMVSVTPEVRSVEVERVRLLNISSIDLDVVEGSLTLNITFHVGLEKTSPSSIPSFIRRLMPSREVVTIEKSVSVPPENIWRYWETIYLGLIHGKIKVKTCYRSGNESVYEHIIYINQDLEEKILEAFQRHVLEKLPPKIYSNPAYLNYLKNYTLLKKLSKKTLRELANHGIVSSSGEALTYFGRMYLLWAERRGQLLAKTLIDAETELASIEELEEALKREEEEESRLKTERLYPCIEELYAERLSEELIKRGMLTPTQSYLAGRLREYFSSSPERPFIIFGVRGVGKTFTVRYVLEDNYRYTYVDKEFWTLKSVVKGEPMIEVFDDWHYLCEGVIRGLIGPEEFKSFLEKLRDGMGVKHVVLVSDEMPSAYLYKLPQELAGIVEELVGLTIKGKLNLQNVNILELEPSSVADYLKHIEGAENSKQFIEFLCKGRLRRLAKILKQFNGVPPIEMLIQWVGERLEIDGDSSRLLLAKLRNDEEELKKIVSEILNKYVKPVEKSKRRKRKRRRKTGQPLLRKRPKTRTDKLQLEEAKKKLEATFREILFTIESNLPKLFGEEVLER